MKNILKIGRFVAVAALFLASVGVASAQINSNVASVNLSLTMTESVTVSASPSSITFNAAGVASGPITVSTVALLSAGHSTLTSYAYFSSQTAFSGPSNINSSRVSSNDNGSGVHSCTGTAVTGYGVAGSACYSVGGPGPLFDHLSSANVSAGGSFSLNDSIVLAVDTSTMIPGTYNAVINFQSQVL